MNIDAYGIPAERLWHPPDLVIVIAGYFWIPKRDIKIGLAAKSCTFEFDPIYSTYRYVAEDDLEITGASSSALFYVAVLMKYTKPYEADYAAEKCVASPRKLKAQEISHGRCTNQEIPISPV